MTAKKKRYGPDAWDTGELGRDERFVAVADESHDAAADEMLGLQFVSIRLPKQLVDQYKLISKSKGTTYQPLMREVLKRFVKDGDSTHTKAPCLP